MNAGAAAAATGPQSTTPVLPNYIVIAGSPENPDGALLQVSDTKSSEEYTVFIFQIDNNTKDDAIIRQLSIDTQISGNASVRDIIRTATLVFDGDEYDGKIQNRNDGHLTFSNLDLEISAGDTAEFELLVSFKAADKYEQGSIALFSVDAENVTAKSKKKYPVSGSASSGSHTLSSAGIFMEPVTTSASATVMSPVSASYGTFQVKFDVTAIGEDIYIPSTAAPESAGGIVGATFHIFEYEGSAYQGTASGVLTSTADMRSGYYVVGEGETETFTVTMTADPVKTGMYAASLDFVRYGMRAAMPTATYHLSASEYEDYVTKAVSILDAPAPQAAVRLTTPNGGESYVAGSGTSVPLRWSATNVPAGATVCTSLVKVGTSGVYAFPGTGSCTSARNGADSHTGTLIRNAGYDLGPGSYSARVQIISAPSGGKDGAVLAEDQSDATFTLKEAVQVKPTTTPKPEVLPATPKTKKVVPVTPEVLPAAPTKVTPPAPEVLPPAPSDSKSKTNTSMFEASVFTGVKNVFNAIFGK